MRYILPLVLCLFLMTGCSATVRQHSNIINAINRHTSPKDYNRMYVYNTFGEPDKKTVTEKDGVRTEVLTYMTREGKKDVLYNMHPQKTRYMHITITNNIVTDVSYE